MHIKSVLFKEIVFPDFSDESALPPPPTPAMFQVDNHADSSSQDDDEDLPPPPPTSLPPPITTPNKINYLTAVTPKPYKSPFSGSNSSTPVPPPPLILEGSQLRDSPISSVSLTRPRSFDLDTKAVNRRPLSSQIANFALAETNSDPTLSKETNNLPWLNNNSQGTSPLEGSSSSESDNGAEEESSRTVGGEETKESNWSVAEQHAERRILGSAGFSMRPEEETVKKMVDTDKDEATAESDNNNIGRVKKADKSENAVQSEKTQAAVTVSIGGASSARSSKSIAKMILKGRKNSESKNHQDESDNKADSDYVNVVPIKKNTNVIDKKEKIQSIYDAEDPAKLVPLTFRRRSEDDDSDDNTEIVARKENKSPDKNVTFAIVGESNNNDRSEAVSKKTKEEGDNKYHLVRAEPFVEGEHNSYKGPRSSKSIANMILNGKKEKPAKNEIVQKKTDNIFKPQLKSA